MPCNNVVIWVDHILGRLFPPLHMHWWPSTMQSEQFSMRRMFPCRICFISFLLCLTVRAVVLQQTIDGKLNRTPSDFMLLIFSGGSVRTACTWTRVQNTEVVILLDHRFGFSFKPLGHHKFYQAWRCCGDPNIWFWRFYRGLYAFGPLLSGSWNRWFLFSTNIFLEDQFNESAHRMNEVEAALK